MRVLIIDSKIDRPYWGSADLAGFAAQSGAEVSVRRAPEGDLPTDWSRFDHVIASGSVTSAMDDSPWVLKLEELVRSRVNSGKPFLGVCFGHQILCRALGERASMRLSAEAEYGWTRIEQVADSRLMQGISREFTTYSSHREEVGKLPAGTRLLARSDRCAIQAVELEGHPVFGIQFHPEKPGQGSKVFDASVGEILFRNFLSL